MKERGLWKTCFTMEGAEYLVLATNATSAVQAGIAVAMDQHPHAKYQELLHALIKVELINLVYVDA